MMVVQVKSIKDNSKISKAEFADIPKITQKLADKTLQQLENDGIFIFPGIIKDVEDLGTDQLVLQSIDHSYRTGNVMGFIGCGQERLNITSRFSLDQNDYFLYYLLEKVLEYPNVFDLEIQGDSSKRVMDLLTFLFPSFLQKAIVSSRSTSSSE